MDRNYIVWTVILLFIIGVISIIEFGCWFLKYMERTRKQDPAKANFVFVFFCLFGIAVLVLIKLFVPNEDTFGEVLNEASAVGIIGLSFFGSISGAIYIARMMLTNRDKKSRTNLVKPPSKY